jgi:hypothetical protein
MRAGIWANVKQFLQSNTKLLTKELDSLAVQGKTPDLAAQYQDLYFKNGTKDLPGYWLPELTYRRKIMESIAEKCKQLGMTFTAEEFIDLWTCKYSDCIDIDGWHAPTAYDIVKFIKSHPTNASLEEVIDHIKKNFVTDKNWEKLMKDYWDKIKCFLN